MCWLAGGIWLSPNSPNLQRRLEDRKWTRWKWSSFPSQLLVLNDIMSFGHLVRSEKIGLVAFFVRSQSLKLFDILWLGSGISYVCSSGTRPILLFCYVLCLSLSWGVCFSDPLSQWPAPPQKHTAKEGTQVPVALTAPSAVLSLCVWGCHPSLAHSLSHSLARSFCRLLAHTCFVFYVLSTCTLPLCVINHRWQSHVHTCMFPCRQLQYFTRAAHSYIGTRLADFFYSLVFCLFL